MSEPQAATAPAAQANTEAAPQAKEEGSKGLLATETPIADPAKPAEGEKPNADTGNADKGKQPEADAVPENYTDFKMEEGFTFDELSGKKFAELAKANKLSQEKAQAFVDLATEHVKSMIAKQQDEYSKIRDEWVKEIEGDPEFGGNKFDETMSRAKRTLKNFTPLDAEGKPKFDILGALVTTGLSDNPAMIKFLAYIDKATGEDKIVKGDPAQTDLSTAEVLFGKNKN